MLRTAENFPIYCTFTTLIHNIPLKLVYTTISGENIPIMGGSFLGPLIAATRNVYLVFGSNIEERNINVFAGIVLPKSC